MYKRQAQKAALAGLVHDCARDMKAKSLLEMARENQLPVGPLEQEIPMLLHGPVGALLCQKYFDIKDQELLRAVAVHTTGSPLMGLLEKIVFLADKLESSRIYPGVEQLREAAKQGVDQGMRACLQHSLVYLLQNQAPLHPDMVAAWNQCVSQSRELLKIHE